MKYKWKDTIVKLIKEKDGEYLIEYWYDNDNDYKEPELLRKWVNKSELQEITAKEFGVA